MNIDKKGKKLIEWRRNQIIEYSSKGFNQADIARVLHVGEATISRDITFLREQAKKNIQDYADNLLPLEYRKCLEGLDAILRKAWHISSQEDLDSREQVQALSLAKDCYSMKLDLLTNAEVISSSMKFISKHKQEGNHKSNNDDKDNSTDDDDNTTIDNNGQKQEGQSIKEEQEQQEQEDDSSNSNSNEVVTTTATELF